MKNSLEKFVILDLSSIPIYIYLIHNFNCSTSDIDDTEFIIYCLNLKFEQEIKKFLS